MVAARVVPVFRHNINVEYYCFYYEIGVLRVVEGDADDDVDVDSLCPIERWVQLATGSRPNDAISVNEKGDCLRGKLYLQVTTIANEGIRDIRYGRTGRQKYTPPRRIKTAASVCYSFTYQGAHPAALLKRRIQLAMIEVCCLGTRLNRQAERAAGVKCGGA